MVVADVRTHVTDLLAVQAHDQPQQAVGARMRGADIEHHFVRILSRFRGILGAVTLHDAAVALFRQGIGRHVCGAIGVFLAQWMPLPIGWHQDAAQVRVPFRFDAEHVVEFTFIPIGGGPDVASRRQAGA